MIDNANGLDILMPMCNLLEKIHNYSMVSGRWQNYYRNKTDDVDANDSDSDGRSFEYKTKIIEETPERPPERGNVDVGQPAQPPVPSLNILSLFHSNSSFWISLLFTFDKLWSRNAKKSLIYCVNRTSW